ncbi:PH domain-containing protein [Tsuneonella sp. HG249]
MTGNATPRRTAPLGVLVGAATDIRRSLLPAAAGAYGFRDQFGGLGFIAAFALLVLAIGAIGSFLRWWRTTYVVGAEDIRLESGIVRRAARSVPYERVQDVSLEQPLIARLLGLVQVRFETGAGGADEIALSYLPLAEGERLRELVRERRDDEAALPTDQNAPAAEAAGQVLFAMPPRRLVTFGLFEFSLAAVAVVAGAAQQLDFLLPFDVWDWDEWRGSLDGPLEQIGALGPAAQAITALAVATALLAIGFLTGLVRTISRDWGFVLERTAKGFRRRRGLFTKTDVVMPAHRVQAIALRTRWFRRRFGWHGLKFVSLAQDAKAGSHMVVPFGQLVEIEPVARAAGFSLPGAGVAWRRPVKRAFVDGAALGSLPLLIAALALSLSPQPALAVLPLLAVPLVALRQAFLWRRAHHAIDERQIYSRRGWIAPRVDVASRVKLHSVEVAQGPLAQRGGYATLHLGLAGGTLAFHALPVHEARRIRAEVLGSIAGVDFSRLN